MAWINLVGAWGSSPRHPHLGARALVRRAGLAFVALFIRIARCTRPRVVSAEGSIFYGENDE